MLALETKLGRKVRLMCQGPERFYRDYNAPGPRRLATAVPLYTFLLDLPSDFVLLTAFDKLQRWQLLS